MLATHPMDSGNVHFWQFAIREVLLMRNNTEGKDIEEFAGNEMKSIYFMILC